MRISHQSAALLVVIALAVVSVAEGQEKRAGPATDRHGDPLPPGASLRLGTVRYRQDDRIERIAYSADGRFVVTDDGKASLQVWDARDGRKVRRIDLGLEVIHDLALSPNGKLLATAGFLVDRARRMVVHRVIFADFETGRAVATSEGGEEHAAMKLAFAPDGKTIATTGELDGTIRLWDAATGRLAFEGNAWQERQMGMVFSPDAASHLLAVVGPTIRLWNAAERREVRQLGAPGGSQATCLAFSPDGKTLAAPAGSRGPVRLWRVADGELLGELAARDGMVRDLAFSPDGKSLAATWREGHLTIWDLATGRADEPFATEGLADGPLAFSPDGRTIATRGGPPCSTSGTGRAAPIAWPYPRRTWAPSSPSSSSMAARP